jgi:hypothetical protein
MAKGSNRRGRLILMFAVAFSLMLGGLAEAKAVVYESASRVFWTGFGTYASRTKVTAGDVNGDGNGDVIQFYYKSSTQSSVYVFRSSATSMAKYFQRSFTMEFSKTQIAAGDYNGDGKGDLYLLHDRGGSTCSLLLMTSDGATLGAPREIYRTTTGGMAFSRARLTATDVNHDGMDEAVILYESSLGKAKVFVIGKTFSQIQGRVEDAVSGADISGVGVTLHNASDVMIASTTSGADGSYTLSAPAGSGYHANFSASDYLPAIYWGISGASSGATSLETVKLVPAGASGSGVASGMISNAFDGNGVADLVISLRPGVNNVDGSLSGYSASTGVGGAYSFGGIPGGIYTGQISGSGYLTTYFTIVSVGGQSILNQNMAITPVLTGNDMRIVLTWGATPSDLDSHITGPISGTSRWHVYFSYKRYPVSGDPVVAILDTDDTSSYGPETITLSTTSGGVYRYSVYNYSSGGSASPSTALADSGAQVRIYQGSSLIRTYNVPNQGGTLWKVFEVSGTTITPFNTMSYHTTGSYDVP